MARLRVWLSIVYPSCDDSSCSRETGTTITISPPLETPANSQGEEGGFFLLKKDSERRVILVQVISEDIDGICDLWMNIILQNNVNHMQLKVDYLHVLLNAIKDYIPHQDKSSLIQAISHAKENFDTEGLAQVQMALITVQEAINPILRNRNVKPHWMFALDNIISAAVQTAVSILSPELSENLSQSQNYCHKDLLGIESNASAMNSQTPTFRLDELKGYEDERENQLKRKYEKVREENYALWEQLIDTESRLNYVLTDCLKEKQKQLKILSSKPLEHSELIPKLNGQSIRGDEELVDWLKNQRVEVDVIDLVSVCFSWAFLRD